MDTVYSTPKSNHIAISVFTINFNKHIELVCTQHNNNCKSTSTLNRLLIMDMTPNMTQGSLLVLEGKVVQVSLSGQ